MSSVNKIELQALQRSVFLKTKMEPRAKFPLLARLLEIFGQRYAPTIRSALNSFDQQEFDQLHRTFCEIQGKLIGKEILYSALYFPETAKLMKKYKPESQSESAFFEALKLRSYQILPFSQKVIFSHKKPDLKILERIESVREKALTQILARLRIEKAIVIQEEKESKIAPTQAQISRKFTEAEEIAATQFYFSAGAFFYGNTPIYFSELFNLWKDSSNPFAKNHPDLLDKLSLRDWAENAVQKTTDIFDEHIKNDFRTFLILCSIDALKRNTGLSFSPASIEKLKGWFGTESVRADLCYFTADLSRFYELNLATKRVSAPLVRSLQLFFFVTRNFNLSLENSERLLTLLLHMKTYFDVIEIPVFSERKWIQPPLKKEEREAFLTSWEGLMRIFTIVLESHPHISPESLLTDQNSSDLLFFFWQHPQRKIFIDTICSLALLPCFSMSLASIYEFCKTNKNALKKDSSLFFFDRYSELIAALLRNKIQFKHNQNLLFDPPLELSAPIIFLVGTATASALQFLELIRRYQISDEKIFSALLRRFILRPNALIFEFLEDAAQIGLLVTENLLSEALCCEIKPFRPDLIPLKETRDEAKEIAKEIQKVFHFSGEQLFFIYLELLRMVMNNNQDEIQRIFAVSERLISFCPFFKRDAIYFLFRYRSKIQLQEVENLRQFYVAWVQNKDQLNRFIIDKEVFSSIVSYIEGFALRQTAICEDLTISSRFLVNCQQSLLSLFFPPIQPLTDYFRITNVTEENGISWGEPSWKTHLGQLKPILSGAEVGVYLNWTIYHDQLVLFLSFFDWRKTVGCSAFVPIKVSIKEIASDEKRKVFYGLLSCLSGQVLREEVEESPPPNAPDTPESWMQSLVGVKETLSSYDVEIARGYLSADHVEQIWEFFKNLKIAYRSRFLSAMNSQPLAPFDSKKAEEIAALGHIFPSHRRGCLLPEDDLLKQAHPEPYIPDAEEALVLECMKRFSHPTNGFESLKFELQMTEKKYLVSYKSQTADQLTGHLEPTRARNEVAPQLEATQGMYVTLSVEIAKLTLRYPAEVLANEDLFLRFFDYHNLLLKANLYYLQIF